jgi:hypothetical protein
MSEYQYYEFATVERPLSSDEMNQLRAISSRARITPYSFTNEYHWGDLKAEPHDLMRKYFDAHIYMANWGTVHFMLRLPKFSFGEETLFAFNTGSSFEVEDLGDYWLLMWSLAEEGYGYSAVESGTDWMVRLMPIREELLCNDLRSLYIGWLAAVSIEEIDDQAIEPVALSGLGTLTEAQKALAELLGVDVDLLIGAGTGSASWAKNQLDPKLIETWLAILPLSDTQNYLRQIMTDGGKKVEMILKKSFATWESQQRASTEVPKRTVHELRILAKKSQKIRLKQEALKKQRAEKQRQDERNKYLQTLTYNVQAIWDTVNNYARSNSAKGYDKACQLLVDLAEAYQLYIDYNDFKKSLDYFIQQHKGRRTLLQRITKAGLNFNGSI